MKVLVGLSLLVFLAGISYRIYGWLTKTVLVTDPSASSGRVPSAFKGALGTVFSGDFITLIKTFFTDVLFQKRLLTKSAMRWAAHSLIFFGFIALLLMHGLGTGVSEFFFSDYQSTIQPFLSLRNLFGLMVLIGLGIALYRRLTDKPKRVKSYASDWLSIAIVGSIILIRSPVPDGVPTVADRIAAAWRSPVTGDGAATSPPSTAVLVRRRDQIPPIEAARLWLWYFRG